MNERTQRALDNLRTAVDVGLAPMEEVANAMLKLARLFRGYLWRGYHAKGCIYGETNEGLERWCEKRMLLDLLGYDYPTGRWHR